MDTLYVELLDIGEKLRKLIVATRVTETNASVVCNMIVAQQEVYAAQRALEAQH